MSRNPHRRAKSSPVYEATTRGIMVRVVTNYLPAQSDLLVSLYLLTMQIFGRPRLALAVLAVALTLPLIAAGSTLMTIDAPYCCCWGWALVAGHRAIFRGSGWA